MRFKDPLQKYIYYSSQIDYSYYMIQEISKHNGKMESPLIAMVDRATGFDRAKVKERIKDVRFLISTVIRCKEKLGYDASNDRKFKTELKIIRPCPTKEIKR